MKTNYFLQTAKCLFISGTFLLGSINIYAANAKTALPTQLKKTSVGETFIVGGMKYKVTAESPGNYAVSLIGNGSTYTGNVSIPAMVTNNSINYNVTSIGPDAFYYCSTVTSINIPTSVTSIGTFAFSYCTSLPTIIIPNSVTSIGLYAFDHCSSLTSITIPDSVTFLDDGLFIYCPALTSVTLPNSLTAINRYAFAYCTTLSHVTIPETVTKIGRQAFSSCPALTTITLPGSLVTMDKEIFSYSTGLTSIYVKNPIPIDLTLSTNVFYLVDKVACKLYVPIGTVAAYRAANQWGDFIQILENSLSTTDFNKSNLKIFPNPAVDFVNFSEVMDKIMILDLSGKAIKTIHTATKKIDISTLPKGIYIISGYLKGEKISKKFIKK